MSDLKEKKQITAIKKTFAFLQNKKILIYGTGIISARLISALSDYNIVGVVDRVKFWGDFEGKTILLWDEITQASKIDVIIIASLPKHYEEIYSRIMVKCITYGIEVYGASGKLIEKKLPWQFFSSNDIKYYKKNELDLKEKIQHYDAISFDLFDTLIMRKTLVPTDVFDIVEKRASKIGIILKDFKKIRREAELLSGTGNLFLIYDKLQNLTQINDEEKKALLEMEIECEIECLIPRRVMVDIMKHAISLSKRVNIISDMYLTSEILIPILKKLDINGYEKLYISCEHGASKGNGLFEIYKKEVQSQRYLHIGDNYNVDVKAAQKVGIDAYFIRSAYDMLQNSAFRGILAWTNNCNEKGIMGLIIADLFNNPFELYQNFGLVPIRTWGQFGKTFIAPVVISYIHGLAKEINKENYQGVLLAARDGYFFKKMLENYKKYNQLKDVPLYYFLTSRKISLCSTLETESDIRKLSIYYSSVEAVINFLKSVVGEGCVLPYNEELYDSLEEYIVAHKKELIEGASNIKSNYIKCIVKQGVDLNGKYLLCDLNSSGTVHECLNKIFSTSLDGFYLHRVIGQIDRELKVKSIYDEKNSEDLKNNIALYTNLLEFVLTAPHGTIAGVDELGNPIYGEEMRTEYEIDIMTIMQNEIEEFFDEYMELFYLTELEIDKELPNNILGNCKSVILENECQEIERLCLYDDMGEKEFSLLI